MSALESQTRGSFGLPGIASFQKEQCRSNAKTVAFIDIITSFLELIVRIAFVYLMFTVYIPDEANAKQAAKGSVRPVGPILLYSARAAIAVLGIPLSLVEHGFAYFLLISIDPTTPLKETIKRMRWWIHYNVFLVIFAFISGVVGPFYGLHFLFCFVRLLFIAINYRSRLEMRIVQQTDVNNTLRHSYGVKPAVVASTPVASNVVSES